MRNSCKIRDLAHSKFLVNFVTLPHEERKLLNTIRDIIIIEHLLLCQESCEYFTGITQFNPYNIVNPFYRQVKGSILWSQALQRSYHFVVLLNHTLFKEAINIKGHLSTIKLIIWWNFPPIRQVFPH